jgi:curli biogenesis system outer membrane secretion channel CsgG
MSLFYALSLLSAAFLVTNANDCSGQALPKAKEETEMLDGNARNALPPYRGIKKEIGVENFDNAAGINGLFPLGLNLAALLKSALIDTERFVVLDRQNLNTVMREQDLQASGRAAKAGDVAQIGKIRSARYMAGGAISEVTYDRSGGGGAMGIPTPFGSFSIGGNKNTAQITCIVTLTDTTTTEIVAKERIVGRASEGTVSGGYSGYVSLAGTGYEKTPIGQAAQEIINQATRFIALKMEQVPFSGSVIAKSNNGRILINRGANYNITPGMILNMTSAGQELIDTETGAVLGREDGKPLGALKVEEVKEKFSYCAMLVQGDSPEPGALVYLPQSSPPRASHQMQTPQTINTQED